MNVTMMDARGAGGGLARGGTVRRWPARCAACGHDATREEREGH
jgi:hypothetical protein